MYLCLPFLCVIRRGYCDCVHSSTGRDEYVYVHACKYARIGFSGMTNAPPLFLSEKVPPNFNPHSRTTTYTRLIGQPARVNHPKRRAFGLFPLFTYVRDTHQRRCDTSPNDERRQPQVLPGLPGLHRRYVSTLPSRITGPVAGLRREDLVREVCGAGTNTSQASRRRSKVSPRRPRGRRPSTA